jgi:hypothetical protein
LNCKILEKTHVIFLVLITVTVVSALYWSKTQLVAEKKFFSQMNDVQMTFPTNLPEISQDSLDYVVSAYGIKLAPGVSKPKLDINLEDRGLTTRTSFSNEATVTIGPAAFSDWSVLASTVAHEAEVHGVQSFFMIWVLDQLGLDGTGMAERQAYRYEVLNSDRFGLSASESFMIADTMNYYYPQKSGLDFKTKITRNMKFWFAKNILREKKSF